MEVLLPYVVCVFLLKHHRNKAFDMYCMNRYFLLFGQSKEKNRIFCQSLILMLNLITPFLIASIFTLTNNRCLSFFPFALLFIRIHKDFWQKLKIVFGNILLAKYVGKFLCLKQFVNLMIMKRAMFLTIYWDNLDQSLNYSVVYSL